MSPSNLTKIFQSARKYDFIAAGVIKTETIPAAVLKKADFLEEVRSLLVLAHPYPNKPRESIFNSELDIYLSRYARGLDYHLVLGEKLKKLSAEVSRFTGKVHSWTGVDNHPLDEKRIAARAGLGFIGRNSLLIIPGIGSMVFLGLIASPIDIKGKPLAVSLKPEDNFPSLEPGETSRCKNCQLCVTSCPGGALSGQGNLTKEKCISQLTQQRGYLEHSQLRLIANHFWGCDDCQLVCPYNSYNNSLSDWNLPGKIDPREFLQLDYKSSIFRDISRYPFSWRGKRILQRNMLIVISNLKAGNYHSSVQELSGSPSPVIRYYCGYYYYNLAAAGNKWAADSLTSLLQQEKKPEARKRLAVLVGKLKEKQE